MSSKTTIPSGINTDTDIHESADLSETGIEICQALQSVKHQLLADNVRPRIKCREDFGRGWCRHIASEVITEIGKDRDVNVLYAGGMGGAHFWIEFNGRHFDAEKPCGVDDWRELPTVKRLKIHGEPTDRTDDVDDF